MKNSIRSYRKLRYTMKVNVAEIGQVDDKELKFAGIIL
jgi:hypothetical protein